MIRTTQFVLLFGVLLASVAASGCRPPNDNSNRDRCGKPSTSKSTKTVVAPVAAAPTAPIPPKTPAVPTAVKRESTPGLVEPTGKPVIREVVRSALPHTSTTEAEADAIEQARLRIAEKLAQFNPPIRQLPPLSAVREQFLVKDSRVVRKPTEAEQAIIEKAGLDPNQVYVEYTVEVTDSQIRQLRTFDRIVDALRVTGGVLVFVLAGFLFLRADEWSRGYLTSWLGLLAVIGVIAGLVGVLTIYR